jgi:hypothetical protein
MTTESFTDARGNPALSVPVRNSKPDRRRPTAVAWVTLAVSVASLVILLFLLVRFFQIEHSVQQFGDELQKAFSTSDTNSAPSTGTGGLPICGPDQTLGCVDPGD